MSDVPAEAPEEQEQPLQDPVRSEADPDDQMIVGAEPMDEDPETDDPNTPTDEDSPIGGGPLYRRKGP